MDAKDWLEERIPGFANLRPEERAAVQEFTFLWTYFEATVLAENGNVPAIVATVAVWSDKGGIPADGFDAELTYFIDRYYMGGVPSAHFRHLNFRPKDRKELVESVLRQDVSDPYSVAIALLIIAFRYRNNLFHGMKWAYELRDQFDNFTCANTVLMKAIELDMATKNR